MPHEPKPIILGRISSAGSERTSGAGGPHPVFAVKLAKMRGKIQSKRRARLRWAMIGISCLLLFAACGQKGDLYLPDEGRADPQQAG